MSKKKAPDVEEGAYWMDTYGDMVTLLLTFFVLLFAMSNVDEKKWEMFVKAFSGDTKAETQFVVIDSSPSDEKEPGNGGQPPEGDTPTIGTIPETPEEIKTFADLFLYLEQYIKENKLEGEIEVKENSDGTIYIQFHNNLFFDGDSAVLKKESKAILDVLARAISSIPEKIAEIQAHGHTAQELKDVENPVAFDRTLSGNRASNVVAYLQVRSRELSPKKYISPDKLTSNGHGQYMPIAPHDGTEATRKKNRRVELLISEVNGATAPSLQDVYDELSGKKPIVTKEEKAETDKKKAESEKAETDKKKAESGKEK